MIGNEEIKLVQGLTTFLSDNPIVIDGGANKADWSDIILKEYGDNCTIHLFEPNTKMLSYCEIKYEYKQNVVFNESALSNENSKATFYYFENFNNELSSLHKQDWWETELPMKQRVVDTITVDAYCKDKGIDCIDYLKLDLEGGEPNALIGCKEMIADGKIKVIQIEYGGHYKLAGKTFTDVIHFVNQFGYKAYSYDKKTNNYNEVKEADFMEDYHYENYIITKEEIHNYSMDGGWLAPFKESVEGLPKFDFVMEIGSYEGLTAKYMCENMLAEGGRMITVDPLTDYYIHEDDGKIYGYFKQQYERFLRNTKGLPIELFREDSRAALPRFHAFRFGFIYIDGNHTGEVVYRDAVNCFPILKKGGYLLFDDAFGWSEDTTRGIEKFLTEYDGQYEIVKKAYQLLIKKL